MERRSDSRSTPAPKFQPVPKFTTGPPILTNLFGAGINGQNKTGRKGHSFSFLSLRSYECRLLLYPRRGRIELLQLLLGVCCPLIISNLGPKLSQLIQCLSMLFALRTIKQIGFQIRQNRFVISSCTRQQCSEGVEKLGKELCIGRVPFVDHLLQFADRLVRFPL